MIDFDYENNKILRTYTVEKKGVKEVIEKPIANFSLSLQAFGHGSDDNAAMLIKVTSVLSSCLKVFTAKEFSTLQGFQSTVINLGYSFMGSNADVSEILDKLLEEKNKVAKLLYLHNYAGRYHQNGHDFMVMFQGVLDSVQGFLPYGELGDVTLQDGTIVIAPVRTTMQNYFPKYMEPDEQYKDVTPQKFFKEQWYPLFKKSGYSIISFGWFLGTMFIDEVMENGNLNFYPFLFITGKTNAGKTQFVRIMRRIAGFNREPIGYDGSTDFSDRHEMQCANALPVWRDEYKNTPNVKKKEPTLRGFYDRSGTPKGTVKLDVVTIPVNGTIMFSGEDMSEDPAAQRRNAAFFFGKDEKHGHVAYRKFLKESLRWPMMVPHIYRRGREIDWSKFEEKYEEYMDLYDGCDEMDNKEKYAILTTIFDLFMEKVTKEYCAQSVIEYVKQHKDINVLEDAMEQFFEEIEAHLTEHNSFERKSYESCSEGRRYIQDCGNSIAVLYKPLYSIYARRRQQAGKPSTISPKVLKKYFGDTYNAILDTNVAFKASASVNRCIIFDKKKCPEALLSIVHNMNLMPNDPASSYNYAEMNA